MTQTQAVFYIYRYPSLRGIKWVGRWNQVWYTYQKKWYFTHFAGGIKLLMPKTLHTSIDENSHRRRAVARLRPHASPVTATATSVTLATDSCTNMQPALPTSTHCALWPQGKHSPALPKLTPLSAEPARDAGMYGTGDLKFVLKVLKCVGTTRRQGGCQGTRRANGGRGGSR